MTMIIQRTKEGRDKFIREYWHEWLKVRVSRVLIQNLREGERILPFYLPTKRSDFSDSWECWIMPLAPFILFFTALKRGLSAFWSDLVYTIDDWKEWCKKSNHS